MVEGREAILDVVVNVDDLLGSGLVFRATSLGRNGNDELAYENEKEAEEEEVAKSRRAAGRRWGS